MTKVVNIKFDKYTRYIGRAGHGLDGDFGNPHPVYLEGKDWTICKICKKKHDRREALFMFGRDFRMWMSNDPKYRDKVERLKGETLGCFCRPPSGFNGRLLCHGQIIAGYLENKKPEEIE